MTAVDEIDFSEWPAVRLSCVAIWKFDGGQYKKSAEQHSDDYQSVHS